MVDKARHRSLFRVAAVGLILLAPLVPRTGSAGVRRPGLIHQPPPVALDREPLVLATVVSAPCGAFTWCGPMLLTAVYASKGAKKRSVSAEGNNLPAQLLLIVIPAQRVRRPWFSYALQATQQRCSSSFWHGHYCYTLELHAPANGEYRIPVVGTPR